jgi:hypothetical protein
MSSDVDFSNIRRTKRLFVEIVKAQNSKEFLDI